MERPFSGFTTGAPPPAKTKAERRKSRRIRVPRDFLQEQNPRMKRRQTVFEGQRSALVDSTRAKEEAQARAQEVPQLKDSAQTSLDRARQQDAARVLQRVGRGQIGRRAARQQRATNLARGAAQSAAQAAAQGAEMAQAAQAAREAGVQLAEEGSFILETEVKPRLEREELMKTQEFQERQVRDQQAREKQTKKAQEERLKKQREQQQKQKARKIEQERARAISQIEEALKVPQGMPPDPYKILGVRPGVDQETLNSKYRMLSGLLHPDKIGEQGRFYMQKINEARDNIQFNPYAGNPYAGSSFYGGQGF